ncbi:hypothetical protein V6Z11_A11G173100 [Gossypium hirsutum]
MISVCICRFNSKIFLLIHLLHSMVRIPQNSSNLTHHNNRSISSCGYIISRSADKLQ